MKKIKILKVLFHEEKNFLDVIVGITANKWYYNDVQKSLSDNYTEDEFNSEVAVLMRDGFVEADVRKGQDGKITGNIKITREGVAFYYDHADKKPIGFNSN